MPATPPPNKQSPPNKPSPQNPPNPQDPPNPPNPQDPPNPPNGQDPPNSHSRIASLDGLRGIAILLVFCWHFLPHPLYFPGWAGVDLFFVLSGYLITGRLLATKGQPNYLAHFYRNRVLRIFPLYYVVVTGFLLLVYFFVSAKNLPFFDGYLLHWKSFFIFTQNWTFILYPAPSDTSLGPLWSVAVEMQLYMIWPFVILLTPSPRSRLILFQVMLAIVFITRIACFYVYPGSRPSIYFNTFFRMDGFLTGSLLCQLHKMQKKIPDKHAISTLVLLLAILVTITILTRDAGNISPFYLLFGYTLLAVLFTLLLHLALQPGNGLAFLKNKYLRLTGRISFCLYLVHAPLFNGILPRFDALGSHVWPRHQGFFYCLTVLTTLLLSFAISIFSYRYFEPYFLRLKR